MTVHKTEQELTEVAQKVKKLLALSKSNNEHEAALAAEKATQLLNAHNMTLTDLEIKTAEFGDRKLGVKYKVAPKWVFRVGALVADNTYCKMLCGKNYIRVIGAKADMEVADYLFNYLVNTLNRLSKEHAAQYYDEVSLGELNSIKITYIDGCLYSLARKFMSMKATNVAEPLKTATGSDLMVVKNDAVAKFYNETWKPKINDKTVNIGSTITRSGRTDNAFVSGMRDGKNISIHKGVNGGNGEAQRKLA